MTTSALGGCVHASSLHEGSCSGQRSSCCSAGRATVAARSQARRTPPASYNVGFIYPRTGLLGAYGAEEIQGFKYGLKYATKGTNKVNGKTINLTYVDDKTDPATAVTAAKDLIGQGYKIIAGHRLVGRRAPARADRRPEPRPLHLRPGGGRRDHRPQPVHVPRRPPDATRTSLDAAILPRRRSGKKIVVFDQDTAFGHGNFAAVKAVIGGKGHTVSEISVPLTATDFTPFAQQVKNANRRPDLRRVGGHDGRRDVEGARPAERRSTAPTSSPVSPSARPGRRSATRRRRSTSSRTTSTRRRRTR